jgi:hypothetical protein
MFSIHSSLEFNFLEMPFNIPWLIHKLGKVNSTNGLHELILHNVEVFLWAHRKI